MKKIKTKKGTELEAIDLKGKDYLNVQARLIWFRDDCPNYKIITSLIQYVDGFALFKAEILDENMVVIATAHGSETKIDFKDYIEKAETKALGRALGYAGFGTQFMGDEIDEGIRIVDAPVVRKELPQKRVCTFCNTELTFHTDRNMYYCHHKKTADDSHSVINL